MAFSIPNIPGVTTAERKPKAEKQPRCPVAAAICFNKQGHLRVRSENGRAWYHITAHNFALRCECTAAQFGRTCRHIKGDPKTGAKGAAAYLETLDPVHLKGAQLAFYWESVQDPTRKAIRAARSKPVELTALFA